MIIIKTKAVIIHILIGYLIISETIIAKLDPIQSTTNWFCFMSLLKIYPQNFFHCNILHQISFLQMLVNHRLVKIPNMQSI